MTVSPSQSRRFTPDQRQALWLASDGRCQSCGRELRPGWHADHWQPYVSGGATDVINGQALCPDCNLRKGATMPAMLSSWTKELKTWQQRAFDRYREMDSRDFTLVATPGAGKTIAALRIAHWLLLAGEIERVIVVVPTDNLRTQWHDKAHAEAGIQLQPDWTKANPFAVSDYHGLCLTYQQVGNNAETFRRYAYDKRTLVIFDEVHHVADQLMWGGAVAIAFAPAQRRLLLSGTLFREDSIPIPFVTYVHADDGKRLSRADFAYGYADALGDEICRPILFPHHEGEMQWREGGAIKRKSFGDEAGDKDQARRLATALDPQGDFLRHEIFAAHSELTELRRHWNAGGMILAIDQTHAKRVARLVEDVTGETPVLAISEDEDAAARIRRFAEGNDPWLVSVKMVSEGVDIPRLCVGVYATNVTTELFFRQVVGRFVRVMPGQEGQMATLFVPADERLIAHCLAIKEERQHALDEIDRRAREMLDEFERKETGEYDPFTPLVATPGDEGLVYDGQRYDTDRTREARRLCAELGKTSPEHIAFAAQLLEKAGRMAPPPEPARQRAASTPSVHAIRTKLKASGSQKARRLGQIIHDALGRTRRDDGIYMAVNAKVKRAVGTPTGNMNEKQLAERDELLARWIRHIEQAQRDNVGTAWLEDWLAE